ncbi:MAG TPA: pre-peptidase C-terminal domain-containing protein [Thermoanaerobaculia bacterium]|nr:pre-peptidase C-terminal domain-containing protein [Thermoanaerobaculia bacterium]
MGEVFHPWTRRLLAALSLLALATPAHAAIPKAERSALEAFYKGTGGPKWSNRAGWLGKAGTECAWSGVSCNPARTTVVGLSLNDRGLTGSLPASLAKLPGLQFLELEGNALTGALPKDLGKLANLRTLRLGLNLLSGALPKELGNLAKLETLSLPFNRIPGALPPELGRLASLRVLDLSRNAIAGAIPPQLGNLVGLRLLDLSANRLNGGIPLDLGRLTGLTTLFLSSNQLSGPIPRALGSLRALQQMSLSDNQLSGRIPPELGNLTKMMFLDLQGNQLSGVVPAKLGDATSLIALVLSKNRLGGNIPGAFLNLANLEYLWLDRNLFTGPVPFEVGALFLLADGNGLDLRSNALATDTEPGLLADLNTKQAGGDWRASQAAAAAFDRTLPLTGLADRRAGKFVYWTVDVAAGAKPLTVTTEAGTGNADLYVRFGAPPTLSLTDAVSAGSANQESVTVAAPRVGRYYIGVYAKSPYSGVNLRVGG